MRLAKYYPELTENDMAFLSGVSKSAIRRYIVDHSIDPNFDKALIRYRTIQEYLLDEEHRNESDGQISKALTEKYGGGYSRVAVYTSRNEINIKMHKVICAFLDKHPGTTDEELSECVKEQLDLTCNVGLVKKLRENPPLRPAKGKISVVDLSFSPQMLPRVSDDEGNILRLIRKTWLKRVPQFECDLTYGKGDFYRNGERAPEKYRFDKYPEAGSDVMPLEMASTVIPDDSLMSAVIDLPQAINSDGNGDSAAFGSVEDMVLSYYNLVSIAYNKLKQSLDRGQGGILVVKVGDFDFNGKRLWIHHFVTDLATGNRTQLCKSFFEILEKNGINPKFDLILVDKAVHTFQPIEEDFEDHPIISRRAHDYFLIFQKTKIDEEALYVNSESRHTTFPTLHVSFKKNRDYYRHEFIFGTKMTVHRSTKLDWREIRRKVSTEAILHVSEALADEQLARIQNYDGFPFEVDLHRGMNGRQVIESLLGELWVYYNPPKSSNRYVADKPQKTKEEITAERQKYTRLLSDVLYKCGFAYLDFGNGTRVYFEKISDETDGKY